MIRFCPNCRSYFADASLTFCPADGAPLIEANPASDDWHTGTRIVEEKSRVQRRKLKKLKLRRMMMITTTVVITTVVAGVAVINGLFYLKPSLFPVATPTPTPTAEANVNENGNDNVHVANTNGHVEVDVNANLRLNGNANTGTNVNGNANVNANVHTNRNANLNPNANTNTHVNSSGPTNANVNTNGGVNSNVSASSDCTDRDRERVIGIIRAKFPALTLRRSSFGTCTSSSITVTCDWQADGRPAQTRFVCRQSPTGWRCE